MKNTCVVCGAPLPKFAKRYCSEKCRKKAELERDRDKRQGRKPGGIYREFACMDCGKVVYGHIKSKRCEACQKEKDRKDRAAYIRRKKAGKARQIGSVDICPNCGEKYIVDSGKQKYCKKCAPFIVAENVRAAARARMTTDGAREKKREQRRKDNEEYTFAIKCKWCGKEFERKWNEEYCSEACRTAAFGEYQKAYIVENAEKIKKRNAARWAAQTPEEKEKANARARENYWKRKERNKGNEQD